MNKQEWIEAVAFRSSQPEEIYLAMKREEKVTLVNFGSFYIDVRRSGTVFKFNPSQKWRALFGWTSIHKGEL